MDGNGWPAPSESNQLNRQISKGECGCGTLAQTSGSFLEAASTDPTCIPISAARPIRQALGRQDNGRKIGVAPFFDHAGYGSLRMARQNPPATCQESSPDVFRLAPGPLKA